MSGNPDIAPMHSASDLAAATAHRPCADALRLQDVVGDPDLLALGGVVRRTAAAVGVPGAHGELQATVVAVSGVDRPVATGLTGGDGVPVHAVRIGGTGTQCDRRDSQRSGD